MEEGGATGGDDTPSSHAGGGMSMSSEWSAPIFAKLKFVVSFSLIVAADEDLGNPRFGLVAIDVLAGFVVMAFRGRDLLPPPASGLLNTAPSHLATVLSASFNSPNTILFFAVPFGLEDDGMGNLELGVGFGMRDDDAEVDVG